MGCAFSSSLQWVPRGIRFHFVEEDSELERGVEEERQLRDMYKKEQREWQEKVDERKQLRDIYERERREWQEKIDEEMRLRKKSEQQREEPEQKAAKVKTDGEKRTREARAVGTETEAGQREGYVEKGKEREERASSKDLGGRRRPVKQ